MDESRAEERHRGVIRTRRRGGLSVPPATVFAACGRGLARAVRTNTPLVVVEGVAESEGQLVAHPMGAQVEIEPRVPSQDGARRLYQHETIPMEQPRESHRGQDNDIESWFRQPNDILWMTEAPESEQWRLAFSLLR